MQNSLWPAKPPMALTDELDLAVILHMVEGHGDAGRLTMQYCELAPVWFPGESNDGF